MTSPDQTYSEIKATNVRVSVLETDVHEIKESISRLGGEVGRAVSDLGDKFQKAFTDIQSQLTERSRTPWGVIISGVSATITLCVVIGGLAMSPLQSDVKTMKSEMVPRVEHDFRHSEYERRFTEIESNQKLLLKREYDRLIDELHELKRKGKVDG